MRVSMRPKGLPEVPVQTAAVARAEFPQGSLAIRLCHRLHDAQLAAGSLELPGAVFAAPSRVASSHGFLCVTPRGSRTPTG